MRYHINITYLYDGPTINKNDGLLQKSCCTRKYSFVAVVISLKEKVKKYNLIIFEAQTLPDHLRYIALH